MPIWAPARAPLDAAPRTRVVVHTDPRLPSSWLAALAARSDVQMERADLAEGLSKSAREARLVVVEMPDLERDGAIALDKVRALRAEGSAIPIAVLVGAPGQPLAVNVAATAREGAFAAGATDVVFLPDDQDRLEETVCALAGITARRYTRHRVRLNVTLEDGSGEKIPAVAENLSRGGIQLRLTRAVTTGQVVRMRLPLTSVLTMEAWGLVRGSAPSGSGHIARLRFVGMRAAERKDLDQYLGGLDRDTRSTEPAEAIAAVRRLDAAWLRSGVLEPAAAPDWLEAALANLTRTERRALEPGAKFEGWWVWAAVAVARAQTLALTEALEKYDPVMDDEPEAARETVMEVVGKLRPAMDEFERMTRNQPSDPDVVVVRDELANLSGRLERAVSARVPELGGAFDRVSGYLQTLRRLEEVEEAGEAAGRGRLKNRLIAVIAGLLLSATIVYAFVVFASRGPRPGAGDEAPTAAPTGTTP